MTFFSSKRERRLWSALVIVLVAIYATLAHAPAIAAFLRERNELTSTMFLTSLVTLVVISILFVRKRPGRAEIAVGVGIPDCLSDGMDQNWDRQPRGSVPTCLNIAWWLRWFTKRSWSAEKMVVAFRCPPCSPWPFL